MFFHQYNTFSSFCALLLFCPYRSDVSHILYRFQGYMEVREKEAFVVEKRGLCFVFMSHSISPPPPLSPLFVRAASFSPLSSSLLTSLCGLILFFSRKIPFHSPTWSAVSLAVHLQSGRCTYTEGTNVSRKGVTREGKRRGEI